MAFSLFFAALSAHSALGLNTPSLTWLGGYDAVGASGISDDGSTVVGWGYTGPFRWTEATGLERLSWAEPFLAPPEIGGVSGDGSVVVGDVWVDDGVTLHTEAFRWTEATGIVSLGLPFGGSATTSAIGVSVDGSRVLVAYTGYGESTPGSGAGLFYWTQESGFQWSQFPNNSSTRVTGFSDDGSALVGDGEVYGPDGWSKEPFVWSENAGYVALGRYGTAYDISTDLSVVVGTGLFDSSLSAFRWTEATGMVPITLPGETSSVAQAVSNDGSIVVGQAEIAGRSAAFVWDAEHGARELKDVLTETGLDLANWSLENAVGISGDGRRIVGTGVGPYGPGAWVAVIPEPSTGMLVIAGMLGLAGWRRARA